MVYTDYNKNTLDITKFKEYVKNNVEEKEDNTIKNYKIMCQLIGEEECTGNSKKAQINRWKRYFEFHKEGQKFVIDEIYDEPFPTDDARKRREGLYVKYIELLLLEFLSKQVDYKVTLGNKEMYRILGMTNDRYDIRNRMGSAKANEILRQTIMNNEDKFAFTNSPKISNFDINNFYFRAEQKLNRILYSALRSMKDRFLIDYKKVNIIAEYDDEESQHFDYRESNAYEDKIILEAKNKIIKEMGYDNMTEIMLRYKCDDFYEKFNDYIKEEYGWEKCYPQLRVVYIDDIAKQIPLKAEEIKKLSIEDKRTQLNEEIIKCLNTQAEKKYKEAEARFFEYECDKAEAEENGDWGKYNPFEKEPFMYKSDYVEIQMALTDYLLNIRFNELEVNPKKNDNKNVE